MTLRGLTWDHPRAYQPLQAFATLRPDIAVSWDRQSLAAFEAKPIAELAQSYDLMIIDHPGLGAAIAAQAIQPLDQLVPADQLAAWQAGAVGPTWASYTVASTTGPSTTGPSTTGPSATGAAQQWAIPIDAATQVSVFRPDLLAGPPGDWSEVPALARRHRTALCLGGPHAFLTLLAMCASARPARPARPARTAAHRSGPATRPPPAAPAQRRVRRAGHPARRVGRGGPGDLPGRPDRGARGPGRRGGGLLPAGLRLRQLRPARTAAASAVAWADAPTFGSARPGSVLGGTGLAVSAPRRPDPAEVRRFLIAFGAPDVQAGLVPAHGGQPALAAAWDSAAIDQAWGGYYRSTRRSLDAAWVRPRADGWITLQEHASALVRAVISGQASAHQATTLINASYRELTRPERAEAGTT